MHKRVIVLDETLEAENRWPEDGVLCRGNSEVKYAMCCLGCLGLTYGLSPLDMRGYTVLTGFLARNEGSRSLSEYTKAVQNKAVPDDVMDNIRSACLFNVYFPEETTFEKVAATLNDKLAIALYDYTVYEIGNVTRKDVDSVVSALRILFAWMGFELGEEWVINHIKDDRIFE